MNDEPHRRLAVILCGPLRTAAETAESFKRHVLGDRDAAIFYFGPGYTDCAFHGIRPSIPRASGRPFHEHPATLVRGLQGFSSFWISVSAVKGVGGAEGCPREGPACPAPRPPRGWR